MKKPIVSLATLASSVLDGKTLSESYNFITGVNSEWHSNSPAELKRKAENITEYFSDIYDALESEDRSSSALIDKPTDDVDVELLKRQVHDIAALQSIVGEIQSKLEEYKSGLNVFFRD